MNLLSVAEREYKSDEHQLIISLGNGDQDAFRYIIKSYQRSVIRICRGFVNSLEDAEDIAQDVFIQLYKSASKLRGEASLSTWLYRVAVNKSLNHIRSNKTRRGFDHSDIDAEVSLRSDSCADRELTSTEHRQALHQAIDKLPTTQRTAFVLQKYEDLSYEEISGVMEMSLSSVQSLIFRAKKNLQDNLRDYFENNLK